MTYFVARVAFSEATSIRAVKDLWAKGKDFTLLGIAPPGWVGGRYFSKRDWEDLKKIGVTSIQVRYGREGRKATVLNL